MFIYSFGTLGLGWGSEDQNMYAVWLLQRLRFHTLPALRCQQE